MAMSRERASRERVEGAEEQGPVPAPERVPVRRPLFDRPLVRAGVVAWSVTGVLIIAAGLVFVMSRLSVVIVPLILAVFPAAVLVPPMAALKRRGVPPTLAALLVMVAALGLLGALLGTLAPAVADQLGGLAEQLEAGYAEVRQYLASGPLGIETLPLDQVLEQVRAQAEAGPGLGGRVLEAGIVVVEGVAGVALGLFALFFYLKDGERIAGWIRDLFPARVREDVQGIGNRVWFTIGAYIRGLLVIGLVDGLTIGIGLLALRVPLALPLAVLVFFGALFPIIGAFLAGTVAVLVALATNGLGAALAVLVLIVVVQQVEGHVLTPILLGRATEMHPLGVIVALGAGGVLMGVLGAFLAVPVAASIVRSLAHLRRRRTEAQLA
jgi:predicted PurR-regulated permease PerM